MNESSKETKSQILQATIRKIEKQFGKGSIMKMGEYQAEIDVIPTGCLSLDIALGVGGLPKGRIIEIYGPESSGKTTLALSVVASCQKSGGTVAYIDAEHAMDPSYAKKLNVDVDNMLISQPDSGEQALEIADSLVVSGGVDLIVIDSVAALVPKSELEGEMGDSVMGAQARLMSQALRKLTANANTKKCTIIFINQIRMKIGVMFGSPETTTGGNALKFYASVRLDIRRTGSIKNNGQDIGNSTRVKVVKNKVAPPFRQCEFDILFGKGIDHISCIINVAEEKGILEKAGSWYSYASERLSQGKENLKSVLMERNDLLSKIETDIRSKQFTDDNKDFINIDNKEEELSEDLEG